jgi:hypothetical protein
MLRRVSEVVVEVKELVPMSPDLFRAELKSRGWTPKLLCKSWGMTKQRVQQIAADADRPNYYDDAVKALPVIVL